MRTLMRFAAYACLLVMSVAPSAAQADSPKERLVVLHTRGVDDIAPEFTDTLRELLSRVDMILVTADARNKRPKVVAYVDIEASERGAIVWVSDPKRNLPRLRREVPLSSSRDVFRETLAHVVLGAVETYAADVDLSEPSQSSAPAPAPAVAPEPTPPSAKPEQGAQPNLLYDVSARGGPLWFAPRQVGATFGAGFRMTLPRRLPPSWSIDAAFMLPAAIDEAGIRADLQLVSVRATQRFAFLRTKRVVLDLGLGLGFDRWVFTPTYSDSALQLGEASKRMQPMAGVVLGINFAMTEQLVLVLNVGSDLDAAPRRWVIETAMGQATVLEPSHFRPYASLAISWTLNAAPASKEEP
jgi:hypothetical protein